MGPSSATYLNYIVDFQAEVAFRTIIQNAYCLILDMIILILDMIIVVINLILRKWD